MSESETHLSTRQEEALSLSYIYDELHLNEDQVSGSLLVPVELEPPVRIKCTREEEVRFLPGITFRFSTGDKYPESAPPEISLVCSWLSRDKLEKVEKDMIQIWETSKELCLFNMIDELSERAKTLFGLEVLHLEETTFEEVIAFAEREEHIRFEQGIYFCGVCLENKKGTECFKLSRCGHIFCQVNPLSIVKNIGTGSLLYQECLRDYYGMCITEGLVNQVTCCDTTCSKSLKKPPDPKTPQDHSIIPCPSPLFPHSVSSLGAVD
jgi:E3 ubiquitin-protein ligase RNF14